MQTGRDRSLWTMICAGGPKEQFLQNPGAKVPLSGLHSGSAIRGSIRELREQSVAVATSDQLAAALALIQLDGVVKRLVLCPHGLSAESILEAAATAEAAAIVTDREDLISGEGRFLILRCGTSLEKANFRCNPSCDTQWVLFTSGTTGRPKMAVHSLSGLIGAIKPDQGYDPASIWATFYDIRRYGGLQIFLRAMLGKRSFLLSSADESVGDHLNRLAKYRATHISGTPSHWRRVLMSSASHKIAPDYIRLSGEIADQGVLDGLHALYPKAKIVHAYASTEAGVGFEVHDGQEGFPASLMENSGGAVELKAEDGALRIRSNRKALCYLGASNPKIGTDDGFVDTGDLVEFRGNRHYFTGRRDGVINVGGQKVHPEEVEAIINRHPRVRMSLVRAKKSPVLGAIVVADVVPKEAEAGYNGSAMAGDFEEEIRAFCVQQLPRHKVPGLIRSVSSLQITPSGKVDRRNA
ncbi:MAG: ANL family adenylate-forming protein [Rhodomicrobium sp.]